MPVLRCAEIAIFGDGLGRVLSEAKEGLSEFSDSFNPVILFTQKGDR